MRHGGAENKEITEKKVFSCAHSRAVIERATPAIHVDIKLDSLTDTQLAQLCFLEIRIDPDLGQRSQGHQPLPGLHIVAGVHIPSRHGPIDFGKPSPTAV